MYLIKTLLFSVLILFSFSISAQTSSRNSDSKVYKVNPWVSGSITLVGGVTNIIGIRRILDKDPIPESKVLGLNRSDVNGFDRYALNRDISKEEEARKLSDLGLSITAAVPVLLFLDKDIRKDWLDITLMYLETQAIDANIFSSSFLGPTFIERYRPRAYYSDLPIEDRTDPFNRNSFFSGHVSTTATGSFFAVKVYSDYHPELGGKKYLLYGLAVIPPAFVGLMRIHSMNHFPTDTLFGLAVGAAAGILIPHIHKVKQGKMGLSVFYEEYGKGLAMKLRF